MVRHSFPRSRGKAGFSTGAGCDPVTYGSFPARPDCVSSCNPAGYLPIPCS